MERATKWRSCRAKRRIFARSHRPRTSRARRFEGVVFSYIGRFGGGNWSERDSEYKELVRYRGTDGRKGKSVPRLAIHSIAREYSQSPQQVRNWPATDYLDALLDISARNQADDDRANNAKRDAGN